MARLITDRRGTLSYVNHRFESMCGREHVKVALRSTQLVKNPDFAENPTLPLKACNRMGASVEKQLTEQLDVLSGLYRAGVSVKPEGTCGSPLAKLSMFAR